MVISNAIGTFRVFLPARISRHIAAASANRNVTSITAAHVTDAIKDEANRPANHNPTSPARGNPERATRPIRHSRESEAGDDCREIAEDHLMGVPAHSLERARRIQYIEVQNIEVQIMSSWLGFSHGLARSLATNRRRLRNANGLSQDEPAYERKLTASVCN